MSHRTLSLGLERLQVLLEEHGEDLVAVADPEVKVCRLVRQDQLGQGQSTFVPENEGKKYLSLLHDQLTADLTDKRLKINWL